MVLVKRVNFEFRRFSCDKKICTHLEHLGDFLFEVARVQAGVGVEVGAFGDGFHWTVGGIGNTLGQ